MKITLKKSFAVILALVMCVSVLFGMNLSVFAASNTIDYVYDSTGTYIYNWGIREQEATFLSQNAEAFYNQNPIATLLALDGSSDINAVTSSELYEELHSLMKNKLTKPTSYNGTRDKFQYTDCENSAKTSNKISSFYSGNPIGPDWDGGNTWNREHTWPNSKGEGQGENDIMMLRPTAKSENGGRSNTAYGESGSYYNPNEESNGNHDLRGDVARIALYQYVCWGGDGNATIQSNLWGYSGVIESKKVLLKWMQEDPVDTWELGRNDSVQSITGTRNVFVDYPELAFDLFNVEIPKHQTPSGYANGNGTDDDVIVDEGTGSEGNTGDSTGGSTVEAQATITFDADKSQRTSYSTSQQVWENDGLKLTNNKASSTTNVGDYSNPGRFYKSSEVIIEYPNMTSLVIDCTGLDAKYVVWENSLNDSNATAKTENQITTITFATPVDSVTFASMSAQARAVSITAYGATQSGGSGGDDSTEIPTNAFSAIANDDTFGTVVTNGNVVTVTPADGYKLSETEPYLVEGGEATVTDNGNGTYTISNVVGDVTISFNFEAIGNDDQGGSSGGSTEPTEIVFNLGANGNATHSDGSGVSSYTETVSDYTLTLENLVKVYKDARDAKGNSAIKLGTGDTDGSFSMEAPGNVTAVIFNVAQYKTNATVVEINGTQYNITTSSNDGEYTPITIDTTTNKQITFKATGSKHRCMIDSITYVIGGSSGGDTPDVPSYTITAESNNASYGTVTLTGNTITAKAEAGYTLADGDAAYTVTSGTATVVRDGDTFTVTATSDATITINFVALPEHTVQFMEGLDGDVLATTKEQYIGGQIILPAHSDNVPEGYEFRAWAEQKNETDNSKWFFAGNKYPVNGDTTLYAQYSEISDIPTESATITFDDTQKRIEFDAASHQTWTESGIIVINQKGASTSAIADYAAPVRFYKNSELIVSLASPDVKITKIVVNANTSAYANALKDAISDSNAIVTINTKAVIIEFIEPVYRFEVTLSIDQVRLDSMVVSTVASSGDDIPTYVVKFVENGNVISSISAQLGSTITLPSKSSLSGEVLTGWLASGQTEPLDPGSSYTVLGDVTFTAKYEITQSGGSETTNYYKKVTSSDELTDGKYLIVYESGNLALNGSLSKLDAANNGVAVEITNNKINANDTTTAAQFTINFTNNTITSSLGCYIGSNSTNNTLSASTTTKYTNTISIDANGNAVITGQKGTTLRFNSDTSQKRFRYFGSGQQAVQLYKLVEVGGSASEPSAEIKGAQVSVGSDLSLNYYVSLTNVSDIKNVVMKFTLDGKEVACSSKNTVDGKYVFTLDNIPPQAMTATIKAVLFDGDNKLTEFDYTIKQNALNLLAAYANDEKLKQFIVDMLYYGAAAQEYTGYHGTVNGANIPLANAGISGTPSSTAPTTTDFALSESTGTASFKSANVYFDSTNKLVIKINNATNATLKVNGVTVDITNGVYTSDGILATQFGDTYTFELIENDEVIQTLTYSINAYAYSKWENSSISALAQALYKYGVSAKAYADSIK